MRAAGEEHLNRSVSCRGRIGAGAYYQEVVVGEEEAAQPSWEA